jgi:hypothetical protein
MRLAARPAFAQRLRARTRRNPVEPTHDFDVTGGA